MDWLLLRISVHDSEGIHGDVLWRLLSESISRMELLDIVQESDVFTVGERSEERKEFLVPCSDIIDEVEYHCLCAPIFEQHQTKRVLYKGRERVENVRLRTVNIRVGEADKAECFECDVHKTGKFLRVLRILRVQSSSYWYPVCVFTHKPDDEEEEL